MLDKIRTRECKYCLKKFQFQRITARFCSDSCRVQYHNIERDFERDAYAIRDIIARMDTRDNHYPERSDFALLTYDGIIKWATQAKARANARRSK